MTSQQLCVCLCVCVYCIACTCCNVLCAHFVSLKHQLGLATSIQRPMLSSPLYVNLRLNQVHFQRLPVAFRLNIYLCVVQILE